MCPRKIKHINRALPTKGHPQMYNFHRFFARKQSDVISEYIKHYLKPDEIFLDPFCGSGVHVIEAVKLGGIGIGIDLNPHAIFLSRNTIRYINPHKITSTFRKIESEVAEEIESLYITKCRKCGTTVSAICYTWNQDKLIDVRYYCQYCTGRRIDPVSKADKALYAKIENGSIAKFFNKQGQCKFFYPKNPLYYPDGTPFLKKERFESIDQVFTKRNLIALAMLLNRIEKIPGTKIRTLFKCAFTSMVHLASRMTPVRPTRPYSSLWAQHSYWAVPRFMESNVWNLFQSAVLDRQGIVKAKEDLSEVLRKKKEATNRDILNLNGDYLFILDDTIHAVDKFPDNSIDYVLTDPPYGNSIQYGELLYLWECWIGHEPDLNKIVKTEIIVNPRQRKNSHEYENLLYVAFREIHRVLKPGHYCTITFHNPKLKYRNILYRAVVRAGFDFEKIVYQPPARPSAKGLLQPFGSLTGDYFFRFRKPFKPTSVPITQRKGGLEQERVEGIIIETAKAIIAERAQPTHYTFIQNAMDPFLYGELRKYGLLLDFDPRDIESILKKRIGHEFVLVDMEIGKKGQRTLLGKGWWFKDPNKHKLMIPLNKRVDEAVTNLLRREREVTFTEVLTEVYTKFENALTPEEHTIMDILEQNATKASGGRWRARPFIEEIISKHEEMVFYIAMIGRKAGYKVDIARDEYGKRHLGKTLNQLISPDKYAPRSIDPDTLKRIQSIDAIWHDGTKVAAIFEIEHSTSIVDAVIRGSNIKEEIPRIMIIPEERENVVYRRFQDPAMISLTEEMEWKIITYSTLKDFFDTNKKKKKVSSLDLLGLARNPISDQEKEKQVQKTLDNF